MTSPATPQRVQRPSHSHSQSLSYTHARSPASPATPYTPISLRSFTSSNPSSTLTTPASAKSNPNTLKHLSFSSPQIARSYAVNDASLADLAHNWRSRANENGIKVSKGMVATSHFDEDESFYDGSEASSFLTTEEALLPPPFLSTHRRRALSQSHAPAMNANQRIIPTSPLARKTVPSMVNSATATPPPNRNLERQLKLKGSFTDPAQTRRREAFGVVSNTSHVNNSLDHSLDLFDIDENEVESEYGYDDHYASPRDQLLQSHHDNGQHQYSQDYASYPLFNTALPSQPIMPVFGQPSFSDPFMGNVSMESNINRYHNQVQRYPSYTPHYQQIHSPELIQPIPQSKSASVRSSPEPEGNPAVCSVCSRQNPPRLAILVPCKHALCSACLTSALNIVGEKDMECAVCKQSVEDFKLISGAVSKSKKSSDHSTADDDHMGRSFLDHLFSSPGSVGGLESAFEFERGQSFFGLGEVRASTPPPSSRRRGGKDCVVLRIDNVPWDITPPTIKTWLQQPVYHAHVLLDKKGKTMSHAFVEVKTEAIAAAILRGEIQGSEANGSGGRRLRGSVLGKGRRARGVTVTRSSQEELMIALFPSWRGSFDGAQPSLGALDNDRMLNALECGLITESEITALLYLIRSPDAHFLKVPSLPFHSLIGVLKKFPGDTDSRIFWTIGLRDMLFDAASTATHVLQGRLEKEPLSEEFNEQLLQDLLAAGAACHIFTSDQTSRFVEILRSRYSGNHSDDASISSYNPDADVEDGDEEDERDFHTPSSATAASPGCSSPSPSQVEDLAREFGVEAHLVRALAQRLAGTSLR